MCLAQGHNIVTQVRLEPAAPRSRVKCSTTEPPCSSKRFLAIFNILIFRPKKRFLGFFGLKFNNFLHKRRNYVHVSTGNNFLRNYFFKLIMTKPWLIHVTVSIFQSYLTTCVCKHFICFTCSETSTLVPLN